MGGGAWGLNERNRKAIARGRDFLNHVHERMRPTSYPEPSDAEKMASGRRFHTRSESHVQDERPQRPARVSLAMKALAISYGLLLAGALIASILHLLTNQRSDDLHDLLNALWGLAALPFLVLPLVLASLFACTIATALVSSRRRRGKNREPNADAHGKRIRPRAKGETPGNGGDAQASMTPAPPGKPDSAEGGPRGVQNGGVITAKSAPGTDGASHSVQRDATTME